MENDRIFEVVQFLKLMNFEYLTISRIKEKFLIQFYNLNNLLNILDDQIISKKEKKIKNKTIK